MLCCKGCGSEADVFYRTEKVLYPLCADCYLKNSTLPQEARERIRVLLDSAGCQRGDSSGS